MKIELFTGPREEAIATVDDEHARATVTIGGNRFDVYVEGDHVVIRGRDSMLMVVPRVANTIEIGPLGVF